MKSRHSKVLLLCISLSTVAIFFQNCGQTGDVRLVASESASTLKNDGNDTTRGAPDVPLYTPPVVADPLTPVQSVKVSDLKGYICEPFAQSTEASNGRNGLKGALRFVTPDNADDLEFARGLGAKKYWTSKDNRISRYETPIFFKDINVKPVAFDEGFSYAPGKYLEDGNKAKLVEWFGVKYETLLTLSASEKPGYYKLATVSDDGTIIEADLAGDGKMVEILNNDGIHAPRFQCQGDGKYLYFPKQDSKIKLNIYFYQGPRVQIANVLMFKYVGSSVPSDSRVSGCELNGSEKIFSGDLTSPTKAGVASTTMAPNEKDTATGQYAELLHSGWSIIPNRNYLLPDEEVDPCAVNSLTIQPSPKSELVLSGTKTVVNNSVSFSFVTSLPSEHIIKFFDISGPSEVLMPNPSIGVSSLVDGKDIHSFQFVGISPLKKYRMEVNVFNQNYNISKRTDFLISP